MSQKQIQAVRFLTLRTADLREEIYKFVEENPALEIVEDFSEGGGFGGERFSEQNNANFSDDDFYDDGGYSRSTLSADEYQNALENQADETETLQEHLLHQLNMQKLSDDEKTFCTSLIYNLDRNGCYGNQTAPEILLDRSKPSHNNAFIEKCLWIVQNLEPIGCCCKNLEESLFIQAKILNPDDVLSLFILDGNLEMLNPPQTDKILRKIKSFQAEWHKKAFAPKLPIDDLEISEFEIGESLNFILTLNPHPAAGFSYDSTKSGIQLADIALVVTKKEGYFQTDDYEKGIVRADDKTYFQVSYPSGNLPKVRIVPEFLKKSKNAEMQAYREKYLKSANDFLGNLMFRESTIVLQGCEIVKNQLEFFLKGPGHLKPFTRRQLAKNISVHESTVSRVSSKRNSRFIQTDWGIFPLSYFFTFGVAYEQAFNDDEAFDRKNKKNGKIPSDVAKLQIKPAGTGKDQSFVGMRTSGGKSAANLISSEAIKIKIAHILASQNGAKKISDQKIADLLNEQGIKIARRTVAKYRSQL